MDLDCKDPRTLFKPVFKRAYEPCRKFAWQKAPWTQGNHPESDITEKKEAEHLDKLHELFCCYVCHRMDEELVPNLLPSWDPKPGELHAVENDMYWSDVWWQMPNCLRMYRPAMSRQMDAAVFDILLNTHLWCMKKRHTCFRPEFSLLVSYQDSFLWAVPYREIHRQAKHGLEELEELYDFAPIEDFLTIFYGRKRKWPRDQTTYSWDQSGPVDDPDSASCSAMSDDVFMHGKDDLDIDDKGLNSRMRNELKILLGGDH